MYERAEFVDTRGKKIRICIEILSCFLNATNIFHSITNVTYSMDYFRVTKLSNIESTCYYSTKKKKRKEWLRISFPSNAIPTFTSIEYINLHERSPNFTSLSACHPFENTKIPSTLLLVQTRHTPLDEEHSIRTMVERWIAFVVDERKKNEKKKKKDIRICLVRGWGEGRGWRTQAWSLWQGIVVCIYDTYANGTPFARANRLRFARSSRHAPIQITVHQAAYSRRYGTTPLKLTRRGKIIGESFARSRSKALNIRSGEIILCYLFYRWIDRDNILFIFESWRKMELE